MWANANNVPPKGSLSWAPMVEGVIVIVFMIMVTIKHGRLKCIKCTNLGDELYDVPTCCTKFLKYDPY
jgi:hypothetical protein